MLVPLVVAGKVLLHSLQETRLGARIAAAVAQGALAPVYALPARRASGSCRAIVAQRRHRAHALAADML